MLFLNEGDFVDGRTLLDTVLGGASEWTAPRWADKGDVAFYYYSTRALKYVRRVRRQFALIGALTQEVEEYLARAEQDAVEYGGTIVSYEFATGRAFRRRGEAGAGGHWRTPHYVKCAGGQTLERPLRLMDHRDELPVPYGGTILSLQPAQFRRLVSLLQKAGNRLSDRLLRVVPRTESRHAADAASWRIVGCAPETRFMTEAELRGVLVDHLLAEIKDPRTVVYEEVDCFSTSAATGRVDYVIAIGRTLVPVEAKLNVLTERDLVSQVRKYIGASRACVVRRGRKIVLRREVSEKCVVIDQAGMYVVGAEGYVECSAKRPLIRRPELARLSGSQIRQRLMRVLG